jgi:hypothetical protein
MNRPFAWQWKTGGIWCRWELAFHAGKAKIESHPVLPEDVARHEELKHILDMALQSSPNAIIQRGWFSALGKSKAYGVRQLKVKWTDQ